jgi:hypothetical protein
MERTSCRIFASAALSVADIGRDTFHSAASNGRIPRSNAARAAVNSETFSTDDMEHAY